MLFQFCKVHDELGRLKNHWAMHSTGPKEEVLCLAPKCLEFLELIFKNWKSGRSSKSGPVPCKTYWPLACGEAQALRFTAILMFLSWLSSIFLHTSAALCHAVCLALYVFETPVEMFMPSIGFWKTGVLVPFLWAENGKCNKDPGVEYRACNPSGVMVSLYDLGQMNYPFRSQVPHLLNVYIIRTNHIILLWGYRSHYL